MTRAYADMPYADALPLLRSAMPADADATATLMPPVTMFCAMMLYYACRDVEHHAATMPTRPSAR